MTNLYIRSRTWKVFVLKLISVKWIKIRAGNSTHRWVCYRLEVLVFGTFRDEGQAVRPTEVFHEILTFLSVQSLHHFRFRGRMNFSKNRFVSNRKWEIAADLFLQQSWNRGLLKCVGQRNAIHRGTSTRVGRFRFRLDTSGDAEESSTTRLSLPEEASSAFHGSLLFTFR